MDDPDTTLLFRAPVLASVDETIDAAYKTQRIYTSEELDKPAQMVYQQS